MGNRSGHEGSAAVSQGLRIGIALLALLPFASLTGTADAARDVDARHCLDLGDNLAIARCAEQYRRGSSKAAAPSSRPARSGVQPVKPASIRRCDSSE